ncbi:CD83 antigen [Odontesthes bonariensis]|uniref:CD83 antigen n=1 Tax=Odontesthes bonariensis TaxID=219752 RepID=UPI003F5832FD
MSQGVLFISLLLVHYAAQNQHEIKADCNEDVSLKCPAINNMDFLSLAWYKVSNEKRCGIIRKSPGETTPLRYNFTREAEFGEHHSLLLSSVKPADSGTYECSVQAHVGGKNKKDRVNLMVHECVTQAEPITMTNTLTITQSNHRQVEDFPLMWTLIGYVAVAVAKILLSLISIQIMRCASHLSPNLLN